MKLLRRACLGMGCAILVVSLGSCGEYTGSVTVSLARANGACREFTVPGWPPPTSPLPPGTSGDWAHRILSAPVASDFDFRGGDGIVLVRFSALASGPDRAPKVYSPALYRLDLTTGQVEAGSSSEWDTGVPLAISRSSPKLTNPELTTDGRLRLGGKEFLRSGTRWPTSSLTVALLSSDDNLLAVDGWDGEAVVVGEFSFGRDHIDGNYYVNIYDVGSVTHVLSLRAGHFHQIDPEFLFMGSAWVADRYYLLPLDLESMNRFVLCDVQRSAIKPKL